MSVTESPSICEDATSSLRAGPGSAISPPSPGGTSCFAPFSTSVGLVAAVDGHDQPRVRGQGAPPRGLARLLLRRRVHAGQASSLGLFALRLAVGIGAIHHGSDKLVDPAGFVANGVVPQAITAGTSFGGLANSCGGGCGCAAAHQFRLQSSSASHRRPAATAGLRIR